MSVPVAGSPLFVVFGATGDLMGRKLLPVLHAIDTEGKIPGGLHVLGVARKPWADAAFCSFAEENLQREPRGDPSTLVAWCRDHLRYHQLDESTSSGWMALRDRILAVEREWGLDGNRVLYLALPSEAFPSVVEGLGKAGLAEGPGWTRLVIEKPFGTDLASAQALNATVHRHFEEKQVYRIDHYLGKETVQNLLVFRFANMFIESLWNQRFVEHVQITVAESLGVEGRAEYYDATGALRDMVQNHLTQLLTLIAMEVPPTFGDNAVRDEKVKVLRSIEPIQPSDVVFGQYGEGESGGKKVPAYRAEPGVASGSTTETFVALRLRVSNWRWHGVPFFLRTGKRMPAKSTRIVVTFRAPPISFFRSETIYERNPDRVTIILQPEEGFDLAFEIKVPGHANRTQTHKMHFRYAEVFGPVADAYETLLLDVLRGDQTLFVRADEVEESWRLFDPVLRSRGSVTVYPAGTLGPPSAAKLVEETGHEWSEE